MHIFLFECKCGEYASKESDKQVMVYGKVTLLFLSGEMVEYGNGNICLDDE